LDKVQPFTIVGLLWIYLLLKSKLEEALDSLREKYRDLLPTNERLLACISSYETFELGEWLQVYDTPVDVVLERGKFHPTLTSHCVSDLIWPIQ
jgi:hypothetical protein